MSAFGGEVNYEIKRQLSVGVSATQTDYDSNLPGLDRTVTVFRLGVQLGGGSAPW